MGLSLRTKIVPSLCILFCCLLLLSGCSLPWQRHSTKTNKYPKPTSSKLLSSLDAKFRMVKAFHVTMQVDNPGDPTNGQIQIHNANGDVVMPDKIKTQASVVMSGQSVSVNLISVGTNQFITDPVTGQWRPINGVLDPRSLTNPDTGIISLIKKLQHVSDPTSAKVNGKSCWLITGDLDAKQIAFFTGGGVPAGTMLKTNVCVGKADSLPYQVKVTGQAAAGDTSQTARDFMLSNYNENITITIPQV